MDRVGKVDERKEKQKDVDWMKRKGETWSGDSHGSIVIFVVCRSFVALPCSFFCLWVMRLWTEEKCDRTEMQSVLRRRA